MILRGLNLFATSSANFFIARLEIISKHRVHCPQPPLLSITRLKASPQPSRRLCQTKGPKMLLLRADVALSTTPLRSESHSFFCFRGFAVSPISMAIRVVPLPPPSPRSPFTPFKTLFNYQARFRLACISVNLFSAIRRRSGVWKERP